jgi:FMN reductase
VTFTVAVVSAGLSQPSSTRLLADRLSAAVTARVRAAGQEVLVENVDLRPLAHALADNLLTGFPPPDLAAAVRSVTEADAVIAVTPVFAASYSGLFKMFFDVVEKDALRGVPVLLAATAGSARHSLVVEHALRPLFAYLQAVVVPTGVFAATEDFGSVASSRLSARVDRAADELVGLLVGPGPSARRGGPERRTDPFADVTPFEDLLRGGSGA